MKIKLIVSAVRYEQVKNELLSKGIEIDENADFLMSERDCFAEYLIGKHEGEYHRISVNDILCIESFAHDVILHSVQGDFKVNERLRQLENMLNPNQFLRISNSVIVSLPKIRKIKPTLSTKYILTLDDGHMVDVTRSYYYIFREIIGI